MTTSTSEFLAHHGVKGMKWGVRKDRTSGTSGPTAKKPAPKAPEAQQAPATKTPRIPPGTSVSKQQRKDFDKGRLVEVEGRLLQKAKPSDLSDSEIRAYLARIDLEQRYRTAVQTKSEKRKAASKKFVIETASAVGKEVIKTQASKRINNLINEALEGNVKLPKRAAVDKAGKPVAAPLQETTPRRAAGTPVPPSVVPKPTSSEAPKRAAKSSVVKDFIYQYQPKKKPRRAA